MMPPSEDAAMAAVQSNWRKRRRVEGGDWSYPERASGRSFLCQRIQHPL